MAAASPRCRVSTCTTSSVLGRELLGDGPARERIGGAPDRGELAGRRRRRGGDRGRSAHGHPGAGARRAAQAHHRDERGFGHAVTIGPIPEARKGNPRLAVYFWRPCFTFAPRPESRDPSPALSYNARDITVLEGLDPVRKRPGMYIGGVGAAGLHHLVWEIFDNSVDEAMNGHADEIEVTLHKDGSSDHRQRQRPRHSGRHAPDAQEAARSRSSSPAPRRRKVR